jgi:hypothetical protein
MEQNKITPEQEALLQEHIKRMQVLDHKMAEENRVNDFNRGRAITIGTATGGITEITMRGNSGFTWMIFQPVEVMELIHQLAANIGCHINIQPRKDFGSWREWKKDDDGLIPFNGYAPPTDNINLAGHIGVRRTVTEDNIRELISEGIVSETLGEDFINKKLKKELLANPEQKKLSTRSKKNALATKKNID